MLTKGGLKFRVKDVGPKGKKLGTETSQVDCFKCGFLISFQMCSSGL